MSNDGADGESSWDQREEFPTENREHETRSRWWEQSRLKDFCEDLIVFLCVAGGVAGVIVGVCVGLVWFASSYPFTFWLCVFFCMLAFVSQSGYTRFDFTD